MKLNRITAVLMLSTLPLLANAASYKVVKLPTDSLSLNQFGSAIDETGLMLSTTLRPFNPPIDLSLIDLSLFTLNDPEGAALGNFEEEDYELIANFLYAQNINQRSPLFGQKLSMQLVYSTDGTSVNYVNGLDKISDATNGFTFAQRITIGDSVNGTHIVGSMSGPFSKLLYTNSEDVEQTYTLNDFSTRGFVQVGNVVTELVPENTIAGGISTAVAINNGLQIAGSTSIGPAPIISDVIENCSDPEVRGDQPIEACLYSLRFQRQGSVDNFRNSTTERAVVWQVDASGAILSTTTYGLVYEPEGEIRIALSTSALAINDNGVAVGVSDAPYFRRTDSAAVIFENGKTIRLIEDESLMPNTATGINNNGIVVGFQRYLVGRSTRTKMFTFDRNTSELNFMKGLFVNSSAVPRAINNNNQVVGEADADGGIGARQKTGFIYDMDKDTFTDLNSLLACDANVNIVSADDINDSGEIAASALIKAPARNIKGEVVGDRLVDTIVAVKLVPTGDAPSVCPPSEQDLSGEERQGAGLGFIALCGLCLISLFRRTVKKW